MWRRGYSRSGTGARHAIGRVDEYGIEVDDVWRREADRFITYVVFRELRSRMSSDDLANASIRVLTDGEVVLECERSHTVTMIDSGLTGLREWRHRVVLER